MPMARIGGQAQLGRNIIEAVWHTETIASSVWAVDRLSRLSFSRKVDHEQQRTRVTNGRRAFHFLTKIDRF